MTELGTLWSLAPWTLRLYIGLGVPLALLSVAVNRTAYSAIAAALFLVIGYYLLRRVRWLWIVLSVSTGLFAVVWLLAWRLPAIYNFIALALLLVPPTRRHFARESPASQPQE